MERTSSVLNMADYTSSIDAFVNRILADDQIANPNRYWVEFSFPSMGGAGNHLNLPLALQGSSPITVDNRFNNLGQLAMMCTTAVMPGRQLNTVQHKHEQYPITIPVSQSYAPVTFGFTLSGNLKERRFFELWQDVVVNNENGTMNYYNEYTAPIKMFQLDKNNKATYGVELHECYPTSISDVSYTYAANNEILNMSVSLSYKYWSSIDPDRGGPQQNFFKSL